MGTHVLLEASRRVGVSRFIHVSTDEVYGDMAHDAKEAGEGSVLDPTNPYASSKAAAEFIVKSYVKSYNLPVIVSAVLTESVPVSFMARCPAVDVILPPFSFPLVCLVFVVSLVLSCQCSCSCINSRFVVRDLCPLVFFFYLLLIFG